MPAFSLYEIDPREPDKTFTIKTFNNFITSLQFINKNKKTNCSLLETGLNKSCFILPSKESSYERMLFLFPGALVAS